MMFRSMLGWTFAAEYGAGAGSVASRRVRDSSASKNIVPPRNGCTILTVQTGTAIRKFVKRRGRDSNPRGGLSRQQHFQCCSFSRSDTSPSVRPGILAGWGEWRQMQATGGKPCYVALALSASTRLSTFPVGDRGNSGMKVISRGTLNCTRP